MMGQRTRFLSGLGLLVLLAALAAAVNDHEYATSHSQPFGYQGLRRYANSTGHAFAKFVRIKSAATPAFLVLTVGLGGLAIRRPISGQRRSWPGRGRAALLAGNCGIGWGLIVALGAGIRAEGVFESVSNFGRFQYDLAQRLASQTPALIQGAWVCLAYAGHWRRRRGNPPDAGERAGRLVGWAWLILMVGNWIEAALR